MSSPFYAGSAAIARRWISGSPTILWIGDSISAAYELYFFRAWPVTPAGWGIRGSFTSLGGAIPDGAVASDAGLGTPGVLAGGTYNADAANYNICQASEILFDGTPLANTGGAGFENRLLANGGDQMFVPNTRQISTFSGLDWMDEGSPLNIRTVYLKTLKSVNATALRYSMRNDNNNAASVHTAYFNPFLNLATLTYAATDLTFSDVTPGNLNYELQYESGLWPTADDYFITCHSHITTGEAGMTIIPISQGGYSVGNFLDSSKISQAAWNGVLPFLNLTDIVIALSTNGDADIADLASLAAKLRNAAPDASITFLAQYDVNNAGSAPDLSTKTDHLYAAQQATSNSMFLNLYRAGGSWVSNEDLGFFSDGLHPTDKGSMYFLRTIWSLVQAAAGGGAGTGGRGQVGGHIRHIFM